MNTQGNSTQGTSKSEQAKQLAEQMSKFKTVEAAKRWWNSLSALQKGAVWGILVATGMGGYVVYATYGTVPLSTSIWGGILYGSAAGCCVTGIAGAAYSSDQVTLAKSGLDAL